MQPNLRFLLFGAFLLASCAPQPAPLPTAAPSPTAVPVTHAPEIRFALIGEPRDVNVWELFDESGASYADYALRSEYWPRLYYLSPPNFTFEALAANGMPLPVMQDGEFYSATVTLRTDLKWTDGSPFTAEDVAFTVNTALAFQLGFDWNAYYPREYIDRVEAVDASTVKFIFNQQPNVGIWQYGALQGPIVQKAYWEPRLQNASSLLPEDALRTELADARLYLDSIQKRVDDLNIQAIAMASSGQDNRAVLAELARKQNELIFAQNTLDKTLEEFTGKISLAQQALYTVDDKDEPTLGTWMPAGKQNGVWVNEANPDFPFIQPKFDRALYFVFDDINDELSAFNNNDVDVVIGPHGGPQIPSATASPSDNARFLVFNPDNKNLAEPALRLAIACMIDFDIMLAGQEKPYDGFIVAGFWRNRENHFVCSQASRELKIQNAVAMLKTAGYSWDQEPTATQTGSGLTLPDGALFPSVTLITTSVEHDRQRSNIASYLEIQLHYLGIPLIKHETDLASLHYAAYSSGKYDMALLGWQLSTYPRYLCEWFGVGGQFGYGSDRLGSECEVLDVESDLEAAREHVFEIQSILMEDLPFIPLYARITYDTFQNVIFPFEDVLGGLGGLYGAPSYAMPAQ